MRPNASEVNSSEGVDLFQATEKKNTKKHTESVDFLPADTSHNISRKEMLPYKHLDCWLVCQKWWRISMNEALNCRKFSQHQLFVFYAIWKKLWQLKKVAQTKWLSSEWLSKITNVERFGAGFVLLFTNKTWIWNHNFLVLSWIWKLLNLELKVETLYLDT